MTEKNQFKRQKGIIIVCFLVVLASCVTKPTKTNILHSINEKMQNQVDSWNRGDINGFMQHYWNSDSLMFIGKGGITRGWQKTLVNYKQSYSSKDEMRHLKFINKRVSFLDEETIFVVGNWIISRKDSLGDLSGYYSLIWKNKNNKWVIVIDHSS